MAATLSQSQWLEAIDLNYLADYVPAGGTAVKVAVCFPPVDIRELMASLRVNSENRGLVVADVDAAISRLHMVDQFFGRVAEQLPWQQISERALVKLARMNHWSIPETITSAGLVDQLAEHNSLSVNAVSSTLQNQIDRETLADRLMAKDFRMATFWLLRSRLFSGTESELCQRQIVDWLGGKVRLIGELKSRQIFTKLNRANARHLLGSLVYWIRKCGFAGVAINVDASRLVAPVRLNDGTVNYTLSSRIEAYQVIREFVDSTDQFDGLLLTVFCPPEFLALESNGKGLGSYQPLLFRIYDEVRDLNLANPLTALNRVASTVGMPT